MYLKKILILDGMRSSDQHLFPLLVLLNDILTKQGATVQVVSLRNLNINHCIGCFNCWDKTPGRCIYDDQAPSVITELLASDTVIFFTPLVFGGYSSDLKRFIDRLLPLALTLSGCSFMKFDIYYLQHHQRVIVFVFLAW